MITVQRYHDISAGHRVYNHQGKCKHLHGHNYRIRFKVTGPELDSLGRVVDFGVIKEQLCNWIENNWDHRMLIWDQDPIRDHLKANRMIEDNSIVVVPFNPTAENMAKYLVEIVGPRRLENYECTLVECTVEETRKCSATYSINDINIHIDSINKINITK